jgi:hypothetical protein
MCPECKTSTTGPLINIKKASAAKSFKIAALTKIAKATVPRKDAIISIKVIHPTKSAKAVEPAKAVTNANSSAQNIPFKSAVPAELFPTHQIKQSKISLEEDIITNPHDYETETFGFDLQCSNDHFWHAHKALPVSNGKAFCPKCGEHLRKTKQKKRQRTLSF